MTMIEKVAQAIACADGFRASHMTMARAAIEAMRAPTQEMLLAGMRPDDPVWSYLTAQSMGVRWQAMIDAALREKAHER